MSGAIAALTLAACSGAPAATPTPEPPAATVAPSEVPATSIAPADASPVAILPTPDVAPPIAAAETPATGAASPAASDAVGREAGILFRGAAVCIKNASSDPLQIAITRSDNDQDGYRNTSGTETFARGTWRCMKSDTTAKGDAALARITIASGEVFRVSGFNVPLPTSDPEISVDDDWRQLAVGRSTSFKIGKHPITAVRQSNTDDWVIFHVVID